MIPTGRAILRGSLPKAFHSISESTRLLPHIFIIILLSILIAKLQLELGNCLFYCHSQHFIAGQPLAAKICKFQMLFHRFFKVRLKVLRLIKSQTICTQLEAYCFFLLLQYHLRIIFPQSAKTGRLYSTNPIKKAKCTNKCLKNITKFSNVAPKPDLKTCFS